jgi:hypothetical protein
LLFFPGGCFRAKQIWQGEPAHGETADFQEITTRSAIAETGVGGALDGEHGVLSFSESVTIRCSPVFFTKLVP